MRVVPVSIAQDGLLPAEEEEMETELPWMVKASSGILQ